MPYLHIRISRQLNVRRVWHEDHAWYTLNGDGRLHRHGVVRQPLSAEGYGEDSSMNNWGW